MKTIVWDVDDVLNDLMGAWLASWGRRHPVCSVRHENLLRNPPHEILGISMETYLESLDQFRLSGSYRRMKPIREVKEWFLEHGNSFRHVALSAVPLCAASISAEWVVRHFGAWIRAFHFVPSKRKGEAAKEYDFDKAGVLGRLGHVDLFIDDHAENIAAAERAGINSLLFPRPWNDSRRSIAETLEMLGLTLTPSPLTRVNDRKDFLMN